ncbi:putative F-box protein At3g21120 [Humulus lupulus]|uniref:putative F-box protein At3g21120 n=1 Tax=Humulus lupulus TaxID=3486 RepID=UPI002B4054C7|nr:putative F-box protein At3g21120 [Humulus lupulus]
MAGTTTSSGECLHMPEEAVVEIMSRLPPESLVRSKRVSKSWYALIKSLIVDSAFVAKHLHNTKNNTSSVASFIYQSPCPCEDVDDQELVRHSLSCPFIAPKVFHLSHLDDGEIDLIHHVSEDLPRIPCERDVTDRLENHCNGVVVLTRFESGTSRGCIVLCNPAIMEFRILPDSVLFDDFGIIGAGFGYDSRANDYKIVRLGVDWLSNNSKAVVYSLATNLWKEIKFDWSEMNFDLDINDIVINSTGVFCKGVIYWHLCIHKVLSVDELLSSDEKLHDKLLSFDVSDEIFNGLPLPDNLQSVEPTWDPKWNTLSVWNESLALFRYSSEREGEILVEVWVMMDDCLVGSWIKQLVVGPLVGIQAALTFSCKGDELLFQGEDRRLVSYNVRRQKLRNLSSHGVGKKHGVAEECVFPYVKSLNSVKGRSQ